MEYLKCGYEALGMEYCGYEALRGMEYSIPKASFSRFRYSIVKASYPHFRYSIPKATFPHFRYSILKASFPHFRYSIPKASYPTSDIPSPRPRSHASDVMFLSTAGKAGGIHVVINNHVVTGQNEQSTLAAVQNLILISNAR